MLLSSGLRLLSLGNVLQLLVFLLQTLDLNLMLLVQFVDLLHMLDFLILSLEHLDLSFMFILQFTNLGNMLFLQAFNLEQVWAEFLHLSSLQIWLVDPGLFAG